MIFLIENNHIPICDYFYQNYTSALTALRTLKCSDIIALCNDTLTEEKKIHMSILIGLGKIVPTTSFISVCLKNSDSNLESIIKL
jgi:hypothetical protein